MFDNLKYNLYEILNIDQNADEISIKKSFNKLIKKFHPDKNSDTEIDVYNHIIYAGKILLDTSSREAYDNLLLEKTNMFNDLKSGFLNLKVKIDNSISYNSKNNDLNNYHNYSEHNYLENPIEKFNNINSYRNDIEIEKINYQNMDEFNNQFINNKLNGKFKNQLLEEYKGDAGEIPIYTIGEVFTNINDIDKLYIDDTVDNSKYCSLNRAFTLLPIINQ